MKSSKLNKKQKSQDKYGWKGKKYSKFSEGEAVHGEPMKITKLKKIKLNADEIYEEQPVEETIDEEVSNIKYTKGIKLNRVKNEAPTLLKPKKYKKSKYVEEETLPLEEETPKIKVKKAKKMKVTKVAEEEARKHHYTTQTDNTKEYVYIKLPLEELQLFREYQQQKQQQQIVEQEKILESIVFEDPVPIKKQIPRGVAVPVSKKTEDLEVQNKTLLEQVKEVVAETVEDDQSSEASAEQLNSNSSEQNVIVTQDADQTESESPSIVAPAEVEGQAEENDQVVDEEEQTV